MKIFNEEPENGKKSQEFILILDNKEAVIFVELAEAACKANPKKKNWYKIYTALSERLSCF